MLVGIEGDWPSVLFDVSSRLAHVVEFRFRRDNSRVLDAARGVIYEGEQGALERAWVGYLVERVRPSKLCYPSGHRARLSHVSSFEHEVRTNGSAHLPMPNATREQTAVPSPCQTRAA